MNEPETGNKSCLRNTSYYEITDLFSDLHLYFPTLCISQVTNQQPTETNERSLRLCANGHHDLEVNFGTVLLVLREVQQIASS